MSERMQSLCEAIRDSYYSLGRWPTASEVCEFCHTSLDIACKALARVKLQLASA